MKKILTIVLILSLFFIKTSFAQKENIQQSTNTYTTYTSKYGFSLDYPSNWWLDSDIDDYDSFAEAEENGGNHLKIFSFPQEANANLGYIPKNKLKIEIWIKENMEQSLDDWIKSLNNVVHVKSIEINGKQARKVWLKTLNKSKILRVYYIDNAKGITFYSYPYNSIHDRKFDAIVKSFKFVNENWITHNNETYGFSLKYPPEWRVKEHNNFLAIDFDSPGPNGFRECPVGCVPRLRITILENPQQLSLKGYFDNIYATYGSDLFHETGGEIKKTIIGGYKGMIFESVLGEFAQDIIEIPVNDKIYEIKSNSSFDAIDRLVLNSIKFNYNSPK